MDLLTIFIIAALIVWLESILFPKSAPAEKSIEEELGDALGKYLKEGIKINVNLEKKDK
jgi:hypothetical protein